MRLRKLCDVRQFPLYVGVVLTMQGFVPALDVSSSLFHALFAQAGLGREFGWSMVLVGIYVVAGALFARRETLHIGMFLCAVCWSVMSMLMLEVGGEITYRWTPITMTMPVTAIACWFALFRDMVLQPVQIPERRQYVRAYDNV
jgi:phage shock protein PspC (stress-responsive transcriptional regulator)